MSAQDLARDVEARLGHPVFVSPSLAEVSVEGRIEPNGGSGWRAVVVLRDGRGVSLGTRELRREDVSCDAMRAPLALVIGIMIDPDASLAAAPREPPSPPVPPAVLEKPVPLPVAVSAPRGRPSWDLDTGGSLVGGLGLLPGPAIGLQGGILVAPPPGFIAFEAYGSAWLDQSVAAGAQGSATFYLAYVGGGLCPLVLHGGRVDGFGCASGQLGYLASYGPSPTPNQGQVHLAAAIEARGTVRLVGPVSARVGASFIVPLIRSSFTYDEPPAATGNLRTGVLFRMAPVAGTLDLGLGVVFP